ncbi:MAG TPA: hypothetical protein QGF58_27955 [Myxococcota bacterium]|nr:hypothetical protein [Myxococcota bacterium]
MTNRFKYTCFLGMFAVSAMALGEYLDVKHTMRSVYLAGVVCWMSLGSCIGWKMGFFDKEDTPPRSTEGILGAVLIMVLCVGVTYLRSVSWVDPTSRLSAVGFGAFTGWIIGRAFYKEINARLAVRDR